MRVILKGVAAGSLLAGFASMSHAEVSYSGGLTLGYASAEGKGNLSGAPDISATSFDAGGSLDFGNGFKLDLGLGLSRLEIDGVPMDLDLSYATVKPTYAFGNGFFGGLYLERGRLDLGGGDVSLTSYGLIGGYELGDLTVTAYYGSSETDPDLPSGVDVTDFGIGATYMASADLKIGGGLSRTRIEMGGSDADLDTVKLAAAYSINDAFTVFGGGLFGSVDNMMDVNIVGIGASYDFSTMSSVPVIASIEYASDVIEVSGSDGGLDIWKFGVTIPLGTSSGPSVPYNSVASSVFAPKANVLTETLLGLY
ncbi:porin [Oceanicola sp. S124]|uniref:porin n=1 Tax=Oceanicola sp. S124 TaxID=1042378 RepID=UPI0002F5E2C1|nr:porin [Oceanicola sp. S124]